MKTGKKNNQGLPLTKSHHRWAWMAGATVAATATTPHTLATTAQISLIGNTLDSISGNHLSLSTSAGHPFGTLRSTAHTSHNAVFWMHLRSWATGMANPLAGANHLSGSFHVHISAGGGSFGGALPQKDFALIPFGLDDPSLPTAPLNAGAQLEIEAFNQSATDQTVALLNIFYTELSTALPSLTIDHSTGAITGSYTNVGSDTAGVFTPATPEPSGLALLALGAGGILARRQRRKSA